MLTERLREPAMRRRVFWFISLTLLASAVVFGFEGVVFLVCIHGDSHRHRIAGAHAVGILSPSMSAVFLPTDAGASASDAGLADRYGLLHMGA